MKISLNLVDDHSIVTDGLQLILSGDNDIEILDIARTGEMALAQLKVQVPDVVLLDYSLGNGGEQNKLNGLGVAIEIMGRHNHVKIMMLTMHDSPEIIVPCITAGVHGYMLKSEKNADIAAAIKHLYQYGFYFSPEIAKDLALTLRKYKESNIQLTQRELDVLQSLYQGGNTKEIAEALFISPHTVESHRKSLIQKFEAKNSVHLIYLALQRGYLKVALA